MIDNLREGLAGFFGVIVFKYFKNIVLLSFVRLQFFVWLVIVFCDGFVRLFRSDERPLLGYDISNVAGWVFSGIMVSGIIWIGGEMWFDRERIEHRAAFDQDLPEAKARIKRLEIDLSGYKNHIELTQADLEKANKKIEVHQASNQDSIREIARLQNEVSDLRTKLKASEAKSESYADQTQVARARQAQAEQRANTADSRAYDRLLKEIDPILSNLGEFRSQMITQLKTVSDALPAPTTISKEQPTTSNPGQAIITTDNDTPQPPKKDYV